MGDLGLPQPYGYCNNLRPTESLEETWNPIQAICDIAKATQIELHCYEQIRANERIGSGFFSLQKWRDDIAFFYKGEPYDVAILFFLAVLWTVGRAAFVEFVSLPLAEWFGVLPRNVVKFVESAWKLSNTSFLSCLMIYIAFFRGHDLFNKSMTLYEDWQLRNYPLDLKIGYFIEASYYIHAAYATVYMDGHRSDTLVMCLHHFVTLSLMGVSYALGFLKTGVLIFALNDVSDVFLELGKTISYLRETRFGRSKLAEVTSIASGIALVISWFVCRIICHLTKVWRGGSLGIVAKLPFLPVPFHIYFNIFLTVLYFLYIYWFSIMLSMVCDVLSGKTKASDLEDARDISQDEIKKKD